MKYKFLYITLLITSSLLIAEIPEANTVEHNFGNWRIEHNKKSDNYLLVGVGEVSDTSNEYLGYRYFQIMCNKANPGMFSLLIPNAKRKDLDKEYKYETVNVLAWSDSNTPKSITMSKMNQVVLLSVSKPNESNDVVTFINELKKSKERFSFSVGSKSIEFSTKDFHPAYSTFKSKCTNK
jgi:hypothetical protein